MFTFANIILVVGWSLAMVVLFGGWYFICLKPDKEENRKWYQKLWS